MAACDISATKSITSRIVDIMERMDKECLKILKACQDDELAMLALESNETANIYQNRIPSMAFMTLIRSERQLKAWIKFSREQRSQVGNDSVFYSAKHIKQIKAEFCKKVIL